MALATENNPLRRTNRKKAVRTGQTSPTQRGWAEHTAAGSLIQQPSMWATQIASCNSGISGYHGSGTRRTWSVGREGSGDRIAQRVPAE
jgi:hypothetical protein